MEHRSQERIWHSPQRHRVHREERTEEKWRFVLFCNYKPKQTASLQLLRSNKYINQKLPPGGAEAFDQAVSSRQTKTSVLLCDLCVSVVRDDLFQTTRVS